MKCIWMVLFIAAGVQAAEAQSLEETIAIALEHNSTLSAARQQLLSAELMQRSASRGSLPSFQFKANFRYQTEVMELDFSGLPLVPYDHLVLGAKETYETGVTASQLLFSGFAQRANIRMAAEKREMAEISTRRTAKDIALQMALAYRTAQGLTLTIASLNAALQRAELQQDKVTSLIEQGMALGVDTLSISLAKLTYEQQLIAAKAGLATTEQQLEILAGRAISVEESAPPDDYALPLLLLEGIEALQTLDTQYRLNRQAYVLAGAKRYPTLAVQASLNYGKPGVDYIANEWMTYGIVALGLQWDIWDWGATNCATQAWSAEMKQIHYLSESAVHQAHLHYDAAKREFKAIREQSRVFARAVSLAGEKLRIIQLKSEKGMVSAHDFNEANLELTQAELGYQGQLIKLAEQIVHIDYLSGNSIELWHVSSRVSENP